MSQAIMSFLGGWWARWLVRASGKHAFSAGKTPPQSTQPTPVIFQHPAAASVEANPDASTTTMPG